MKSYSYGRQAINKEDIDSVIKTLQSDFLTQGPKVQEFENILCQITGAKYAIAVNSGTAALHLAVLSLGIGPGDSGITSPMTFVASANCLRYAGADVQLADISPDTALINPQEIATNITSKTKVIIPVHYAGQSCDMESIASIAKKHNLSVIEDAAHAIGSLYKGHKVGSCHYSDLTTFSFHPVKTITTGEGGAITTNNRDLYEKLLLLRTHGIAKKSEIAPWYCEMKTLGFNYRFSDILASLGISQFSKLSSFVKRRRQISQLYRQAFALDERFSLLTESQDSEAAFHLFPLLLNLDKINMDKTTIFTSLAKKGIQFQVHYIPIHFHPYYQQLGFIQGDYPVAEAYYHKTFSLPLYPDLKDTEIQRIATIIIDTIK